MKRIKQVLPCDALSDFCRQMAMLMKAGLSLNEGVTLLEEDCENSSERELLQKLSAGLDEHGSLAQAMEDAGAYPAYLLRMIHLGEETGQLDDVLSALADHYDREDSLRRSIRGAVAYPALMLGMMMLIISVLLTRVMPVFDQVFAQLGTRLTGLSRILMELGLTIREYSVVLVLILVALVALVLWLRKKPSVTYGIIRKIPWSRSLCDRIALCRFAGAMSIALSSGLNTQYAMELATELNEDPAFSEKLKVAHEKIEEGEDLTQALHQVGILTGADSRLAFIGQKTGTVDAALSRIADSSREDADRAMTAAIAMIEPTLVIILSLLVGVLLLSVLFPLLGILATM